MHPLVTHTITKHTLYNLHSKKCSLYRGCEREIERETIEKRRSFLPSIEILVQSCRTEIRRRV
ncbi:hypothetical protein RHMOL_Rhmol13G0129900 [Rhododendron molle]|uniref:Uncharacterized protein n=1 Tax=Rhododendron molle TaxID=49168 RepID=A0ACC0L6P6_RHOML|nr:hypothetical protein RHMOL_Rhmol13G0129900 [Rhododendron molle]